MNLRYRTKLVGIYPCLVLSSLLLLAGSGCTTALFGNDSETDSPTAGAEVLQDSASTSQAGTQSATIANSERNAQKMRESRIGRALANGDIIIGMRTDEVREAWGNPAQVEAAGMGFGSNQRWIYYTGLSSQWSIDPVRVVYFENGAVTGWDTVQR